ncbi:hypothetical protein [Olsenella sp. An293]|uniref:hypothetical protein n=1 Tax=Olsenella sp. An293 TaxID=1965626 RepID=UPI000B3AFAAC|nr:hypothetical protein [Olsenella sp. An293]OUO32133.1 hypothetical protein B5F85_07375 [Olsenella sp. An293]
MLLNGTIECGGYVLPLKDTVEFSLTGTTIAATAQLEAPYVLTEGEDTVASFAGYVQTAVYLGTEEGSVRMRAARELPTESKEAIEAVEANLSALTTRVTTTEATATEAKETAEGAAASASPSVRAASVLYVNASTTLTNSQLGDVRDLIEDFVQGAEYEKGAIRKYDGKFWRMAQKITSTTSQTYLPGTGTESLYTLIDLAADGIRVWHAPTDATNSFALGEKAHHPGEDGPVYVSKRDGNTSEPGTDQWWVLAE